MVEMDFDRSTIEVAAVAAMAPTAECLTSVPRYRAMRH